MEVTTETGSADEVGVVEDVTPELPGDDPVTTGTEDVSGKAVPPGVRSLLLVGAAVFVEVQPVASAVVMTMAVTTRIICERQRIRLPPQP